MLIDCHCHAVNKKIYDEYIEKKDSDKYIVIRSFAIPSGDDEFYDIANKDPDMYIVEHIDMVLPIYEQLIRIEKCLKSCDKIKGIKLYPGYQHFYPNDKELYIIYEFAEKYNLTVVFHSGDVVGNSNIKAKIIYAHPKYVDDIVVNFPNVKFVISHFGFPYILETAMIVSKNDNVFTDISGLFESLGDNSNMLNIYKEEISKACIYYPLLFQKLMYGTDFGGNDSMLSEVQIYKQLVEQLFEDENIRNQVYEKTAKKVYNIVD